jgi:heme/copper-type cytochrome/quinol oxidase subunit 3
MNTADLITKKIFIRRTKDKSMRSTGMSVPSIKDVPQGRLGMWILIAGEMVIFGGLIACYLLYRLRHPEWAEQAAYTSTPLGALNTVVLLTSSFTVVMAHAASLKKQLHQVTRWMSATIGLGLVFLIVKAFEYTSEINQGFTLTSPELVARGESVAATFWSFYYLATGLHALHVLAGMIALFIVMLGARKGKHLHRVELSGMYWHMVDIIWIFLFPLFYLSS